MHMETQHHDSVKSSRCRKDMHFQHHWTPGSESLCHRLTVNCSPPDQFAWQPFLRASFQATWEFRLRPKCMKAFLAAWVIFRNVRLLYTSRLPVFCSQHALLVFFSTLTLKLIKMRPLHLVFILAFVFGLINLWFLAPTFSGTTGVGRHIKPPQDGCKATDTENATSHYPTYSRSPESSTIDRETLRTLKLHVAQKSINKYGSERARQLMEMLTFAHEYPGADQRLLFRSIAKIIELNDYEQATVIVERLIDFLEEPDTQHTNDNTGHNGQERASRGEKVRSPSRWQSAD